MHNPDKLSMRTMVLIFLVVLSIIFIIGKLLNHNEGNVTVHDGNNLVIQDTQITPGSKEELPIKEKTPNAEYVNAEANNAFGKLVNTWVELIAEYTNIFKELDNGTLIEKREILIVKYPPFEERLRLFSTELSIFLSANSSKLTNQKIDLKTFRDDVEETMKLVTSTRVYLDQLLRVTENQEKDIFVIKREAIDVTFIDEYNTKLTQVNKLMEEHNTLIIEINNNINKVEINQRKMKEYLSWVEKNRPILFDFQLYIEVNYKKIQDAGHNPDYVRDNVVRELEIIRENEANFRTALAVRTALASW